MAHNIDMSNGQANVAYAGSRKDVWHKLGQEMLPGQSIEEWAKAAGLDWKAELVQAGTLVNGQWVDVEGDRYISRNDTWAILGHATDSYKVVQPAEVLGWFQQYISIDERFALDVAGSLQGGRIIWATATFNGDISVAGDAHKARLLMSTSFDCTRATDNRATMTRVVCNNTFDAAMMQKGASIRTRHNTQFDAKQVASELAEIIKGFDTYKAMGDAMVAVNMAESDVNAFFRACLDIPHDAQRGDVSTRRFNQFQDLSRAYEATVNEGTERDNVWTAFNAVTRYVDHDRSTKAPDRTEASVNESRFLAAQFGSGAAFKQKAWNLLLPLVKDKIAA